MKKIILAGFLLMISIQFTQAQNSYFKSGKMVLGGQAGISALGMGFGANFEFGITNNIGVMPSFIIHNYSSGYTDWSFKVLDLYGTYHYTPRGGFFDPKKMDTYAMAGISWVSFGAKSGNASEETASNIAFGGGAGTRYYISSKLSIFAEGKYRFASFKTDSYSLTVSWYSVSAGITFAIN